MHKETLSMFSYERRLPLYSLRIISLFIGKNLAFVFSIHGVR